MKENPPKADDGRERPFAAADAFEAHRPRLMSLATKHLDPVLARRLSPEDIVQETFVAALKRRKAAKKALAWCGAALAALAAVALAIRFFAAG